jgi:hypothetical protein
MPYFIEDEELGLFIGECMGLGFFEYHIKDGTLSPDELPAEFESKTEALEYLESWTGDKSRCKVIFRRKGGDKWKNE